MTIGHAVQRKLFRGRQAMQLISDAVREGRFRQAAEYLGRVLVLAVGTVFPQVHGRIEHPNDDETQKFDEQFGLDTSQTVRLNEMELDHAASAVQASYYQPSSPAVFRQIAEDLQLEWERFTFVDCGSGKGLVLLLASELPFKRIQGIEFAANLHRTAVENIRKFQSPAQRCRQIEAVCADATNYSFAPEPTVFYLFNPFGEQVLNGFLENIERSWKEHRRELYFVYVEPFFVELFDRRPFLMRVKEVRSRPTSSYVIFKTRASVADANR
jgi:hypothetical protein